MIGVQIKAGVSMAGEAIAALVRSKAGRTVIALSVFPVLLPERMNPRIAAKAAFDAADAFITEAIHREGDK